MNKTLFIGNFLSKHQGTYGVSEGISLDLEKRGFKIIRSSHKKNKLLRLVDFILSTSFFSYNQIHIDVFSGNSFKAISIVTYIANFRKKKIILTLHGGMLPEYYQKNKENVSLVLKRATHIYSPSIYLQEFFRKENILVNYLPNSITFSDFPFKKEIIGNHKILWVRAFSDIYCPEVAIESFKIIKEKFKNARLTMVGPDKGKLSHIKSLIDKYSLSDSISIVGPIPNNELYKFYQTHEVFLNTTTYESFGVCVAEAASCGIPIISNKVGELPYIWSDENSICFVENNDPMKFAMYIEKIFTDESFAIELKRNAYESVQKFDRKAIINQWIKILK